MRNRTERRRRKALQQLADNPLKRYYATPFPADNLPLQEARIAALDFETTGLDKHIDHILSIGLVTIENMAVQLQSAWHQLVQPPGDIPPASAVVHRITDDQAAGGMSLDAALEELFRRLAGHVVLVHHADIEQGFLDHACRDLYGVDFIAPLIDTEALARRRFERRGHGYQPNDLRLFSLRRGYGMPDYRAHNALSDALATAELFLAMATECGPAARVRLREVINR